jgi:hypothetical protein
MASTCNSKGKPCKSSSECCLDTEICSKGACTASQKSDTGKINYEDGSNCKTKCDAVLPDGVEPFCYANDDVNPDEIQICAYEKNGFLFPVEGCCSKTCPSEQCPPSIAPPSKPEKDRPKGAEYKKRGKADVEKEPFPKLIQLMLIIFAILLTSAGIFLSVE